MDTERGGEKMMERRCSKEQQQYFAKNEEEVREVLKNFPSDMRWIEGEGRDEWMPEPKEWPICVATNGTVLGYLDKETPEGSTCDGCPFAEEVSE